MKVLKVLVMRWFDLTFKGHKSPKHAQAGDKGQRKVRRNGLTFTFKQHLRLDLCQRASSGYSLVRNLAEDLSHPLLQSVQLL